MDVALIVVIAGVIAGGVLGGVLRAWNISNRLHSAEVALATLQGQVVRITKQGAAAERWSKKDRVAEDAKELLAAVGPAANGKPGEGMRWW